MATIQTAADWQEQWFEITDATYLNTAAHAAMPRVSLRAVQVSLEAKRFPHQHTRLRLVRGAKPNSGFPIENNWGESYQKKSH